jgi:prevent-host-death family protein
VNTIGIRDLARNTSRVIEEVERSNEPALVTRHGRPAVAVVPIDHDELEDWILANAPEFVSGMRQAERDIAAGKLHRLHDVMAEIEREAQPRSSHARRKKRR